MDNRRLIAIVAVVTLSVGIGVGVLIGYFSAPDGGGGDSNPENRPADESISERILSEIRTENIRANLRYYASKPHVAGTAADREGAEHIRQTWLEQGLDSARLVPYQVYLQHSPSADNEELANKVQIIDPVNGNAVFTSALREDPFGEEELTQNGIPAPYSAYSATGDVMGDIMYVNYGREEDYEYIINELDPSANFTGKIVLSRIGGAGRSTKVAAAQKYGAVAMLVYADPGDYSVPPDVGLPYPDGRFLPDTAVQVGSINKYKGDPLTLGYPAKEFAHRRLLNETDLPKIPVQPISFRDALTLLSAMAGPSPKEDWRGGLNSTYPVGPGFNAPYAGMKTRVVVNSVSGLYWTYNTVGIIRGEIEPDRYVLIGNHRDAWVLGSVDPTSGTACLMEISRVFGMLKKEGWRPRRTLMFLSFGSEEFGMIGSIEWTEEFNRILADRAVAYLNLDIAVLDNFYFRASATPHLRPVVYEATSKVEDPDPSDTRRTVYDTLRERQPDSENPDLPTVLRIGSGSDYEGFEKRVGVSCISGYYYYDRDTLQLSFYSLYHTAYETVRLVETYIDQEYKFHQAISRTFGEMARILADSLVLPLDVTLYASDLRGMYLRLNDSSQAKNMADHGISMEPLERAVFEFSDVCDDFQNRLSSVDTASTLAVRQVNDQLMLLDKAFLGDLPGVDRLDRHLAFSSRATSSRSDEVVPSGVFPGIIDALQDIDDDPDQYGRWKVVAQQVAQLTHAFEAGSAVLRDVTKF
ncbi:putative N-acetylated-alpha-linked acidic dipeptidase [Diadema antillarum]|uniref:putative N-acetylated-alpha-linked acidic dipeptidase n=1 Tax=Diadema antillarum TaxID=105358 RepID=UPI003A842A3B